MSIFSSVLDAILHLDQYLATVVSDYGVLTYLILFIIIFCETGLVFAPFLPGDSLIFVAGTLAGLGLLNLSILMAVLWLASVLGDTVNYWLGNYFGAKIFYSDHGRFFNKKHLTEASHFYQKHGKMTIVLARFIPILRTFAPFVAGVGKMHYGTFLCYNLLGGLAWVVIFTIGGYFFGNIAWVKENFSLAILFVIVLSLIPPAIKLVFRKI